MPLEFPLSRSWPDRTRRSRRAVLDLWAMAKIGSSPVLVIQKDSVRRPFGLAHSQRAAELRLEGDRHQACRLHRIPRPKSRVAHRKTEALAKGLMPGDIAAQAILSVTSGERAWDQDRGPLLPFLRRVIDSLLNHLAGSSTTGGWNGCLSKIRRFSRRKWPSIGDKSMTRR